MSEKTLTEALENLPSDWFKLSPEVKALFKEAHLADERSQKSKWCLCPNMHRCEYLKRDEYCHA